MTHPFYYLLSGGILNTLFQKAPNLKDEETLAYFVALLKGLAFRLDTSSLHLCLMAVKSSGEHRLPILEGAIRLTNDSDAMVRTVARSAVLRLLSLASSHSLHWLLSLTSYRTRIVTEEAVGRLLVPVLACSVRAAWAMRGSGSFREAVRCGLEELDSFFGFAIDILALEIPTVAIEFAQHLDDEQMQWLMGEVHNYCHSSHSSRHRCQACCRSSWPKRAAR